MAAGWALAVKRKGKSGRPPLASTLFLADRLKDGGDPARLYADWQRVYEEISKWKHIDPKRSFRAAIKNARRRVEGTSGR